MQINYNKSSEKIKHQIDYIFSPKKSPAAAEKKSITQNKTYFQGKRTSPDQSEFISKLKQINIKKQKHKPSLQDSNQIIQPEFYPNL